MDDGNPAFSWTPSPLGLRLVRKRESDVSLLLAEVLPPGPAAFSGVGQMECGGIELWCLSGPVPPISEVLPEDPKGVVAMWSEAGPGRGCGAPFPVGRAGTCCPWKPGDVVGMIHSDIWGQLAKSWVRWAGTGGPGDYLCIFPGNGEH